MTLRSWLALLLVAVILTVCIGCAWLVRVQLDPLLQRLDALEQMIDARHPDALQGARQWYADFEDACRLLIFFVSHDALEQATEAAQAMLLFLRQQDAVHALDNLHLCRRRVQHIRDWEQCLPENVL